MNPLLLAASVWLLAIAAIHSLLGERLVFRRMRRGGWVPAHGGSLLHESHVRILWATWHLATVLGAFVSAALFWLAHPASGLPVRMLLGPAAVAAVLAAAALVLVGTRGRHPGWAGLLAVALLAAAGLRSS